jgi:hypothetical protein
VQVVVAKWVGDSFKAWVAGSSPAALTKISRHSALFAKIHFTLDPSSAYTDSRVASGATYFYEAKAVNSGGRSSARSTPSVVATIP